MPPAGEVVEYEFPVSAEQERLLVLDRMHPDSVQYHVPAAFLVRGPFDLAAFSQALDALVARHESLRTVFRIEDGEYRQVVADRGRAALRVVRDVPAGEVTATMLAELHRPFDLAAGPLLRCTVLASTDGGHGVLLAAHHIVCDGWSLQIVLSELADFYACAVRGAAARPEPLPIQYPDYAAWQRERLDAGEYAPAVDYWRDTLREAPTTLALPTDRPRPAVQSTAAGSVRFVLSDRLQHRLGVLAGECGATAFTVLFAAFAIFLRRISGQGDLVVGVPVSGRDRPEVQGMVGMLTNTLAMRVELSDRSTCREVVDQVWTAMRAAQSHQHAPFSAVVDAVAPQRQLSYDPLVQVTLDYYDDTELLLDLARCDVSRVDVHLDVAKFDFLLYAERRREQLPAQFIYRTDLFDPATVRRWADSFQLLLDEILDDPDQPLTAPDLVGGRERRRVLHDWNQTRVATTEALVPDLIAERAAQRPDALALVCGDTTLTYRALLERADTIAARLRAAGVGPETPVGVCLPRSAEMAVAALAVLRAGGAYVPLDPAQPPSRLAYLLSDSRARLVLTAQHQAEDQQTERFGVPVGVVAEGATDLAVPDIGPGRPGRPQPHDLAYLLYTSGSTGTPKAVAVEHRALTNLATAIRPQFPVTGEDRVLQYVSFGFDVAVSDLFFTWVAGAELHVATQEERLGDALFERLRDSRITYVFLPPAAAMSLPCPPGGLPELRTLAVGGEPCPEQLVQRWAVQGRRVLDAYGPSECTVYSTTSVLRAHHPVTIGRPVANMRSYLLDERLRPVPVGVVGEIYLTGAGMARGYAHRPGMTAERFVADPYGPPGARMYRTGDLGRYDDGGVLSYLGRSDSQVKVRGFRVELGEIETVLSSHPAVTAAAATVVGDALDRRLAAYVVGDPGSVPEAAQLRDWLAQRLPAYLVPDAIMRLDALPVGTSGKLDRAALPEPPAVRPELAAPYVAPTSATEQRIAAAWSRVLRMAQVGVHDNFFDLGGNSVRLMAVLTALREEGTGAVGEVSLVEMFRFPTVATLAAHLDSTSPAGADQEASRRGHDRRQRLTALARRAGANR